MEEVGRRGIEGGGRDRGRREGLLRLLVCIWWGSEGRGDRWVCGERRLLSSFFTIIFIHYFLFFIFSLRYCVRHGGTNRQNILKSWDFLGRKNDTDKWTVLRSHKMDKKLSSSRSGKRERKVFYFDMISDFFIFFNVYLYLLCFVL